MKQDQDNPHHSRKIKCFEYAQNNNTLVTPNAKKRSVIEKSPEKEFTRFRARSTVISMRIIGSSSSEDIR